MITGFLYSVTPYAIKNLDNRYYAEKIVRRGQKAFIDEIRKEAWRERPVVYIATYDGKHAYRKTEKEEFEARYFNFTGNPKSERITQLAADHVVINTKTDCKGDIIREVSAIEERENTTRIIGMIDHDVEITSAKINGLLKIGEEHKLLLWQASMLKGEGLTVNWEHTARQQSSGYREVPCIEGMMPFMTNRCLIDTSPGMRWNISSWGIDNHAWSAWCKIIGIHPCVIDEISVCNREETSSYKKVFRNSLTAEEEHVLARNITREALETALKSSKDPKKQLGIFKEMLERSGRQDIDQLLESYKPKQLCGKKSWATEKYIQLITKAYNKAGWRINP